MFHPYRKSGPHYLNFYWKEDVEILEAFLSKTIANFKTETYLHESSIEFIFWWSVNVDLACVTIPLHLSSIVSVFLSKLKQ